MLLEVQAEIMVDQEMVVAEDQVHLVKATLVEVEVKPLTVAQVFV
jgi:hypothetical protein